MTLEPGQNLSHYRLLERIGEGGMGVVWKAEDTVLGRKVALKVLRADLVRDEHRRQMFLDEARLASSLSHAHVAQVHELGRADDIDFIVMEFVEGQALSQSLDGTPMPPERVANLGMQIAQALARAHQKGLLHRDLKPGNVLVGADGEVKVIDFGLATLIAPDIHSSLTQILGASALPGGAAATAATRAIAGTIPYMSPEQLRGAPLDARSDIFSLGILLYEMAAGQRPFLGPTNEYIMGEILKSRPRSIHEVVPSIPVELDRIIHRSMASKPADRYQTMDDLAADLKRLERSLEAGDSISFDVARRVASRGPRRLRRLLVAGGACLLVAAAAALALRSRVARTPGVPVPPVVPGIPGVETMLALPFEVRGQADGAEYVGRALAEAIAVSLSQSQGLSVLPVPGPQEVPSATRERARAAAKLGASRLLTGAVTREGKALHASVSLVDVQANRILWGTQRGVENGNYEELATTIARAVAAQMGVAPSAQYETSPLYQGSAALVNSPLWGEVLGTIARYDIPAALDATQRVVAQFPQEPEAWVERLWTLMLAGDDDRSPAARQKIEDARRSLAELDPRHPRLDHYRAYLLDVWDGKPREAVAVFTQLLQRTDLSPAMRSAVLGTRFEAERVLGDSAAAMADVQEQVRLMPAHAPSYFHLSQLLLDQGRAAEALERIAQAQALDPYFPGYFAQKGLVLNKQGKYAEALPNFQITYDKRKMVGDCVALAAALHRAGREAEARATAAECERFPANYDREVGMACYLTVIGDRSGAIRRLRHAFALGYNGAGLAQEPDLTPLHGNATFDSLLIVGAKAQAANP